MESGSKLKTFSLFQGSGLLEFKICRHGLITNIFPLMKVIWQGCITNATVSSPFQQCQQQKRGNIKIQWQLYELEFPHHERKPKKIWYCEVLLVVHATDNYVTAWPQGHHLAKFCGGTAAVFSSNYRNLMFHNQI